VCIALVDLETGVDIRIGIEQLLPKGGGSDAEYLPRVSNQELRLVGF
jgi:hypothetical protein